MRRPTIGIEKPQIGLCGGIVVILGLAPPLNRIALDHDACASAVGDRPPCGGAVSTGRFFMNGTNLLRWIIAFKALKAVTLTMLGIVLLTTHHPDPVDLFVRIALAVHLPLTSRLLDRVLAFLADLTISRQTALGWTAFGYASLMGTEGITLYLANRGRAGSRSSPPVP